MNDDTAVASDTCPRCGGGFHCGVADGMACPCGTLQLSPALLARLRQHYSRCLCLRCLAALAAEDQAQDLLQDTVQDRPQDRLQAAAP